MRAILQFRGGINQCQEYLVIRHGRITTIDVFLRGSFVAYIALRDGQIADADKILIGPTGSNVDNRMCFVSLLIVSAMASSRDGPPVPVEIMDTGIPL